MNDEQRFLVDVLLACCTRLDDVTEAPLAYLDDVAQVCARLRPHVADADTPEMLCLQNAIFRTEEIVLDWALSGVGAGAGLPDWVMGDQRADYAAWRQARAELAEIRGEG